MEKVLILALFLGLLVSVESIGEDDRINALPGVNFNYTFAQYSGYLNASTDGKWKFFYWLTESQTGNSATDPLIIWFNGGPGCSSVGGMFEELGPFYADADGKTLYENIFAWNKYANVLAIESPIGVGFSYNTDSPNNYTVGDNQTAYQNLAALTSFFTTVQPRYGNRTWFIAGESYAGIYIPSLTQLVLQQIKGGSFPNKNFGGIAIGNGYMNIKMLTNSLVLWSYYHGIIGYPDWKTLKGLCCQKAPSADPETCDFTADFNFVYLNGSTSPCGNAVLNYLTLNSSLADPYNFYQDCYKANYLTNTRKVIHKGLLGTTNLVQSASQLNYDSTDNQFAFPCYNGDSATVYLNRPDVQKAFHIDNAWIQANKTWQDCNDPLFDNYPVTYIDTTSLFNDIIKIATDPNLYVPNFRILIYNGDVDTVCNFLGDAWLMDSIASNNNFAYTNRYPWIFRNQIAGYHQSYYKNFNDVNNNNRTLFIDVLTVKGSGHFVPNDRQGPSNQMIYNFIKKTGDYNNTNGFNAVPAPLPSLNSITTSKPSNSFAAPQVSFSGVISTLALVYFLFYYSLN